MPAHPTIPPDPGSIREFSSGTSRADAEGGEATPPVRWAGFSAPAGAARRRSSTRLPPLTTREREIVALLELGLSNKQIARRLSIRLATVKNHVHNVLAKLQVARRGEAAGALRGEPAVGRTTAGAADSVHWGAAP